MTHRDQINQVWFQPGDRLGDYEIIHVMDRGTFSYNLEVRDLAGRVFHGIVHCREDLRPEVTLAGIRFEAGLTHPGLPKIEHVGAPCEQSRGHVWFVREYLDRPLAHHVWTSGATLSADEVFQIGRGVCELFEYLQDPSRHSGSVVVHGFLVPGYIHRASDGTIKVAGLDVQVLVRSGTPLPMRHRAYRCPECIEATPDALTPANDLWALAGCMLFLATAQPPTDIEARRVEDLSRAHKDRVPLQRARQIADARLRHLIEQAFDPDPQERFRSAGEFREKIECALRELADHDSHELSWAAGRSVVPGYLMVPDDQPISVAGDAYFAPRKKSIEEVLRYIRTNEEPLTKSGGQVEIYIPGRYLRFLGALGNATAATTNEVARAGPSRRIVEAIHPGKQVGPYRIVREIGEGAFAAVYLAEDANSAIGRQVALKIPKTQRLTSDELHRLQQEAIHWRKLSKHGHPNILQLIDLQRFDDLIAFVVEFNDGTDLAKHLAARGGCLPVGEAVRIMRSVAEAVATIHAHQVYHGDLKPANVLIQEPAGVVKVTDFGASRNMTGAECATGGGLAGTAAYMAPEVWKGRFHLQSDIFSLGVMFFELTTGARPFAGKDLSELEANIAAGNLAASPGQFRPDLPPEAERIILRCLAGSLRDRYATAADFVDDLKGLTIKTHMVGVSYLHRQCSQALRYSPSSLPGTVVVPASLERSLRVEQLTDHLQRFRSRAEELMYCARLGHVRGDVGLEEESAILSAAILPPEGFARLAARGTHAQLDIVMSEAFVWEIPWEALLEYYRVCPCGWELIAPNANVALGQARDCPTCGRPRHVAGGSLAIHWHLTYLARGGQQSPANPGDEFLLVVDPREALLAPPGDPTGICRRHVNEIIELLQKAGFSVAVVSGPMATCASVLRLLEHDALVGFYYFGDLCSAKQDQGLMLADGMLSTRDVVELKLRAQLVVLNACARNVADGSVGGGATPASLIQALARGGRTVLAPVWPVIGSQGAEFALEFFQQYLAGERLGTALLSARLRSLGRYNQGIPDLAWMAYRCVGDPNRVLPKPRTCHERSVASVEPDDHGDLPRAMGETRKQSQRSTLDGGDYAFSSQTVIARYPAPIAIPYSRFFRQAEAATRMKMLFSALEATLRYLVTLGISDLFHILAMGQDNLVTLPEHDAFDFLRTPTPMSLGRWLEALRETARVLANRSDRFVKELPEVCAPGSHFVEQTLGWLVTKRNESVHEDGSIAITADECREAIGEARPRLEEALQQIDFVRRYPLGFVRRMSGACGVADGHCYHTYSCVGATVDTTQEARVLQTPWQLQEGIPFIVAPDDSRLLYTWPLLQQRIADQTGRHSLYVFEGIPDRQRPYLTEIRSSAMDCRDSWRRILHSPPCKSHNWLMQRLRELPAALMLPAGTQITKRLLPSRDARLVGRRLGPNQLTSAIASGGFGTIYAARTDSGEMRAVKVIEHSDATRHLRRFQQEFDKSRKAAQHPGIIQCFELGTEVVDDRLYPWYSMEFALGGDLAMRILERKEEMPNQLPWLEPTLRAQIALEFVAVVAAVAHLHQLGIIHRDIKPSNVLIMENGELRLSDFGLVKNLAPSEQSLIDAPHSSTGAVLGTRRYMAPEQERGEDVDKRADVYSLGILLAELVTGHRPETDTHVHQGTTLHRWKALRELPEPLAKIIRVCTDVDPKRRPGDAGALSDEFAPIASIIS